MRNIFLTNQVAVPWNYYYEMFFIVFFKSMSAHKRSKIIQKRLEELKNVHE